MANTRQIEIVGLPEFRRDLAAARKLIPNQLRQADQKVADLVARGARQRAPSGPHLGGGVVEPITASIHAGVDSRGGYVQIGGPTSPQALPTEFGGTLARHNSSVRTRVVKRGYAYPTISAESGRIDDIYLVAIFKAVGPAFPSGSFAA
jgi:hypothetical protein